MRVSTLLENSSISNTFRNAHGLSLLIECANQKILFDTGPDNSLIYNAKSLNEDLTEVAHIVLSHGHSDHTGGLAVVMQLNKTAPIYIKSDANEMFYSKQIDSTYKDISMPINDFSNPRFRLVKDKYKVSETIFILSVNYKNGFVPNFNKNLYKKNDDIFLKDDFSHELILCIKESDGLVVFTGCSHSGIGNMLATVAKEFPTEKIKAVFGGMHLYNHSFQKSEEVYRIMELANELLKYEDCHFYTGHCTGEDAHKVLKEVFNDRIHRIKTGTVHQV
jgi:7,8-dihydropterin-6-yl-methyl-4-(beta-D-ribofuranosyl)aminobenzene 5'-phosphate synthase